MFFRDISPLRKLQAIRRDFVANVSHEMKTPISSLIGYFETLLDHPNIPRNQRELYLRRSLIQAKKMNALVLDLLQISDLEQGKEIQFTTFSLKKLLEDVVANYHHKSLKKKQHLELSLPKKDILVQGDPKGIGIILDNLLQNAISYTPEEGKIKIYVSDLENSKISVFVKDTGMGIDAKYIDRIFQRFYRVNESRDIHQTGTGLGLSIVKHIIEAHGEYIGVDSKPGEGSTFWFTLKKSGG
jgi:two-component system phosphate regulon sensor histidine kinase PhoR